MLSFARHYFWSLFFTLLAVIGVSVASGIGAGLTIVILIAIEIAFSFDNAIVNAKILTQLNHFWQQLFLTVGMVVAIVGMRLVFPILIVAISGHLGFGEVVRLALHDPARYAEHLEAAHPAISAFGAGFLLTLALYFLLDDEREVRWLTRVEARLQRLGGYWWLAPVAAALIVAAAAGIPGNHHAATTLQAGMFGIIMYTAIEEGIAFIDRHQRQTTRHKTGWAAFGAFMYLQLLDASFSFDGVLGAFAITSQVLLIAIGLGVGALWVRSLTVQLVRNQTLGEYIYLEHGAHYAILALSLALLASIVVTVPDAVTGLVGLAIIGAAYQASRQARRK